MVIIWSIQNVLSQNSAENSTRLRRDTFDAKVRILRKNFRCFCIAIHSDAECKADDHIDEDDVLMTLMLNIKMMISMLLMQVMIMIEMMTP